MAKGLSMKVLLSLQAKEFQKGLNSLKRQIGTFKSFLGGAFALTSVTMFGKKLIEVGKDFESAMAKVQAVTNASSAEFAAMQKEAQRMGETTRYTATEAANALENLTRNGMSAKQATKALSGVLQLAQANSIGLAEAADIITNTLNMFGLSVNETSRVNDVLSSAVSNAATNITDLYDALTNAAPAAKTLGFSLEETSAAIGALAQRGVKGADAGTQLRMSLTKMADPKIVAKLNEYGVAIDEMSMKEEGLIGTVKRLRDANLSLTQLVDIFSQRGAVGMQQLIQSYSDFAVLLDVTKNSAGTTARMFEQSVGSVEKELDTLKSMYEGLLISISQKTSGVVKNAIKLLQNLINNFKTVSGTIMNIASVAVPLLASKFVTLGKTLKTFFLMVKTEGAAATAMMGGWITAIASLVTWVGTALVGAWNRSHAAIKEANAAMDDVAVKSKETKDAVKKLADEIGDGSNESSVNGAVAKAIKLFPEFADALRNAHRIANQTRNYDKLKKLLQDIADLQELIATKDAKNALADANAEMIANQMWSDKKGTWWNPFDGGAWDNKEDKTRADYSKYIIKSLQNQNASEDLIKAVLKQIANYTIQIGADNKKKDNIQKLLKDYNIELSDKDVYKLIEVLREGSDTRQYVSEGSQNRVGAARASNQADSTSFETFKQSFIDTETYYKDLLQKKEINQKDFDDAMADAAENLRDSVADFGAKLSTSADNYLKDVLSKYPRSNTSIGGGGGGGNTNNKTDSEKVKDIFKNYEDEQKKLKNQFDNGAITQEEYDTALQKLQVTTYKSVSAFSDLDNILKSIASSPLFAMLKQVYEKFIQQQKDLNQEQEKQKQLEQYNDLKDYSKLPTKEQRDTKFDYMYWDKDEYKKVVQQEEAKLSSAYANTLQSMVNNLQKGIENGDFDLVKQDAVDRLKELNGELETARNNADNLQHKVNLTSLMEQNEEMIEQFKDVALSTLSTLASSFDRLFDSIKSIAEAFGAKLEWKGLEKVMSVINGTIQLMESMCTIIKTIKMLDDLLTKAKELNAAKQAAANAIITTSEGEKAAAEGAAAAAEGASSVAGIPIVGPALAVAAVGAIVAAILAGMGKFATGGIVGGTSTQGDKLGARVNSGEMILNKSQQGTLWSMLNGKGSVGGNVEFKIKGSDLVGSISNYNNKRRG